VGGQRDGAAGGSGWRWPGPMMRLRLKVRAGPPAPSLPRPRWARAAARDSERAVREEAREAKRRAEAVFIHTAKRQARSARGKTGECASLALAAARSALLVPPAVVAAHARVGGWFEPIEVAELALVSPCFPRALKPHASCPFSPQLTFHFSMLLVSDQIRVASRHASTSAHDIRFESLASSADSFSTPSSQHGREQRASRSVGHAARHRIVARIVAGKHGGQSPSRACAAHE
jgi:hypothetical protein